MSKNMNRRAVLAGASAATVALPAVAAASMCGIFGIGAMQEHQRWPMVILVRSKG